MTTTREPRTELVPIAEACRRLAVGQSTLYRGLKAGTVPGGRQIGGRWIIARAVFERWLVDGIEPETPLAVDEDPRRPAFLRKVDLSQRRAVS